MNNRIAPPLGGQKRCAPSLAALAALIVILSLVSPPGITPASANGGNLYVDGANGTDDETCGSINSPCQTISYTLANRSADGDTLLIAAGTYTENLVLPDGQTLALRGGYTVDEFGQWMEAGGETIVDATGSDQSVVSLGDGNGASITLEYLTLTGGSAPGAGGVWAANAEVTVDHCLIYGNTVVGENGGGGLGGPPNTSWFVSNSRIIENEVDSESEPGGTGGASGIRAPGPLTLVNTLVADNQGEAAIHVNGDLFLMNVTVANNAGDIIFNPIDFTASPPGPGGATLTITNSIVYGNGMLFLGGCPEDSTCIVTYSDVEGWPEGGAGNIQADPLFVASSDYHLGPASPCINRGTPTGAPSTDVEGTPRDSLPDMGAYEWVGFRMFLPLIRRISR